MALTRRTATAVLGSAILALGVAASPALGASSTATDRSDVREVSPGTTYRLDPGLQAAVHAAASRRARAAIAAAPTPAVGTVRPWIALDDVGGFLYLKDYTLRAVGSKVEVWVASGTDDVSAGTAFPAGDCRNDTPGSTDITDAQAQYLADEFDNNMFPRESAAFSTPPDRDGTNALISGADFTGNGDRIVVLVDNVRDDNFYDFPARPTYIAGFFSSQFNDLVDRNVMTVDAYDWLHRTGANPPDQPTADLCTSRPARPFLYESTFAHEYQHLLMSYTDPLETTWVNEGLSDFAQTLTGYVDTRATVFQRGADSHLFCFTGFGIVRTPFNPNPRDCGGPQNSLTLWGDDGDGNEILADYGNAYSFMLFLYDRYGLGIMTGLHRDGTTQGLPAVQAQLDTLRRPTTVARVIDDYQVMNLVDDILGVRGRVSGARRADVTTASLSARVNLENPRSYVRPGAAPNGADYVTLKDGAGTAIPGGRLRSLSFTGARTLPSIPLQWTVVADPPGAPGNPAIWSGNASNLDASAVIQASVSASDPTLTIRERHLAEPDFDYAYTTISTDGGATYTPLANANTVAGPLGPALNGDAAGFETQTFDLTAYVGQTVLIGFRYVSDGGVNDGGWYIDDVSVGGTLIADGSSTAPFRSPSEISPTVVSNWTVQLVGLDERRHRVAVRRYNGRFDLALRQDDLERFEAYPTVVAIIGVDDPTEQVQQYAPYTLRVNGVTQPGG